MCEFKISLVYRASSRTASATQRNLVSKTKQTKQNNNNNKNLGSSNRAEKGYLSLCPVAVVNAMTKSTSERKKFIQLILQSQGPLSGKARAGTGSRNQSRDPEEHCLLACSPQPTSLHYPGPLTQR